MDVRASMLCLLSLTGALLSTSCHRDPPSRFRPGEIVPIDPAGLARLQARQDVMDRPRTPGMRVHAVIATVTPNPNELTDLVGFARAFERRAVALDGWSPRASISGMRVRMTFGLTGVSLFSVVKEQLARPGKIELYGQVPCPAPVATPDSRVAHFTTYRDGEEGPYLYVPPSPAQSVAPLSSITEMMQYYTVPLGMKILHGPIRAGQETARRTYCVRTDSILPAPEATNYRATLHPATLDSMLDVELNARGTEAFQSWSFGINARQAPIHLLLAIDGEVMGTVTAITADAGAMVHLQVIPNARLGSVSPELVGALWQSGPLNVQFTLGDDAAPIAK